MMKLSKLTLPELLHQVSEEIELRAMEMSE